MIQKARATREQDKLERRQEILDAAERLFLARPEGLASMDELAEAAGVAKGTLYLYFPSKELVLLALHERNVHAVFDALDREVAAKTRRSGAFTLDDLTGLARRLIIESPIYLPLATLVIGFIERSVPVEIVTQLHTSIGERVARTGTALEQAFQLPAGDGARLLGYSHAFVLGLWQMSGCGRLVAEQDNLHPHLTFLCGSPEEFQRALETLASGMLAPRAPNKRRAAKKAKRRRS